MIWYDWWWNIAPVGLFVASVEGDFVGISELSVIHRKLENYQLVKVIRRYVKPSWYNTGSWQRDRRTDSWRQRSPRLHRAVKKRRAVSPVRALIQQMEWDRTLKAMTLIELWCLVTSGSLWFRKRGPRWESTNATPALVHHAAVH